MILHEFIDVNISSKNRKLYQDKGYNITSLGIYSIKTVDLLDGAKTQEERQCDLCGKVMSRSHRAWADTFKSFNKDLCPDCAKRENRIRIKESNLKKYGVEFPMQSKEIREKASQTSLEKYGCKHPLQSEVAKQNKDKAILDKYGVTNVRYIKEVNDKIAKTNLRKYNCENPFGNKEVQQKIKNTIKEKYGVENVSQNYEIQKKKEATCESNYGVKFPTQNQEILQKVLNSWYKNGTAPASKAQIKTYELCKDILSDYQVELNFPISQLVLDIAIFFPDNEKINIEYDGWFWHRNKQKDRARDEILKQFGYRIIRIKSSEKVPTKEQILEAINYLIKEDKKYTQIILSDWKEVK